MTLVYLHGFTGQGGGWPGAIAPHLPGHAHRPIPAHYSLWQAADDLAAELPDTFDLLGYSLGARLALHLAIAHPQRVNRLVLIGAATHVPDPQARVVEDEVWAHMLETEGLETFYRNWDARPIFSSRQRQTHPDHDPLALAQALRAFSPGRQDDLRGRLAEIDAPTLWLAGEHDPKFVRLAHESAPACRRGQAATVPGCGHDVPLERPEALARLLTDFLSAAAPVPEEAP
ncbi:MAG: esterase [Cyanobacteria bacterium RYN_339]|nr:esterase [Cyanobacteria bacterium RYN_339]